jgi:ubiquinone/menaquinone biosynthesis C-methylase UbiE
MLTLERKWDKRVQQWHSHVTSAAAFEQLLKDMLEIAAPRPTDACVDLGAGTGFVTMALAPLTSSVLAVDISSAMAAALAEQAAQDGLVNVSTQVADLSEFQLQPASFDLVVSSYALHHLVDADKRALVARSAQWLRPGGRLVIGDMMFGRGVSQRDRDILRQKVIALAAKGPGGLWRIVKNLARYGLRVGQEHPATPEFWQAALRDAGFTDVTFRPVVAEAGIVSGVRPAGAGSLPAGAGSLPAGAGSLPAGATMGSCLRFRCRVVRLGGLPLGGRTSR